VTLHSGITSTRYTNQLVVLQADEDGLSLWETMKQWTHVAGKEFPNQLVISPKVSTWSCNLLNTYLQYPFADRLFTFCTFASNWLTDREETSSWSRNSPNRLQQLGHEKVPLPEHPTRALLVLLPSQSIATPVPANPACVPQACLHNSMAVSTPHTSDTLTLVNTCFQYRLLHFPMFRYRLTDRLTKPQKHAWTWVKRRG
jgi:hypothetical protein